MSTIKKVTPKVIDIEDLEEDCSKKKKYISSNVKNSVSPVKIIKSEIISASRRTDIPAFYMDNILESLKNKYIDVTQKFGQISRISLDPTDVKCIVWWSKNYKNWIDCYLNNKNLFKQYKHMFNFTINDSTDLESGIKLSLDERLAQLKFLSDTFGSICIKYRFDPIVKWIDIETGEEKTNFHKFNKIIKFISKCGVKEVIFAFCIPYNRVCQHMKKKGKLLIDFSDEEKEHILYRMIKITNKHNVRLSACCNDALVNSNKKIHHAKCIDGDIVEQIIESELKHNTKDKGQRKECNCAVSRDIGSYTMKCKHSCDYCYANPE